MMQAIVESVSARRRRQRVAAAFKAGLASAAGLVAGALASSVFEPPQFVGALGGTIDNNMRRNEPRQVSCGVAAARLNPHLPGMTGWDDVSRDQFARTLREVCPNAATRFVHEDDPLWPHFNNFVAYTPGAAGAASPWLAGAAPNYTAQPAVRDAEQQTHGVNHITEPTVVHSTKIVEDVAKAVQMNSEAVVI